MRLIKLMLAALSFSLFTTGAVASTANPVNGEDYRSLDKAQEVAPGSKVEVTEFFAYWCPHCNAFDPYVSKWVKAQGDKIIFKRVPVFFHDGDEVQQKMYYALEALGKNDALHESIFHAIHQDRKPLREEGAIADFVASKGVDRAKFVSAFDSFGVQAKVKRAAQLIAIYNVDAVPTVAIDGRFETSPSIAGSKLANHPEEELFGTTLTVMDWLVAKAANERKSQAAVAPAASAKTSIAKK
jgi:thiol:disulfide interchange protein DsbA